jgi:hypothetical protein
MRKITINNLQSVVAQLKAIHEKDSEYERNREAIIPEELCNDGELSETDRLVDDLQALDNIITMLESLADR